MQWDYMNIVALNGDFPDYGATGMFYTMSSSAFNIGKDLFIHTAILKILPWREVALGGLILQLAVIIFFVPTLMDLI